MTTKDEYQKARKFFYERTNMHIGLVGKYIKRLLEKKDFRDSETYVLSYRTLEHDKSKFSDKEREGFIWLTWYYKNNMKKYPEGKEKIIEAAWKRHYKVNPHHPEYYQEIDHFQKVDIAEMIADHAAMSEELKNSLVDYTKDTTIKKYQWNEYQRYLIWEYVNAI